MMESNDTLASMSHYITAFYHFFPVDHCEETRRVLLSEAEAKGVKGIFILGPEGINSTCAAPSTEVRQEWEKFLRTFFGIPLEVKHSVSEAAPFRRFSVKIRQEICTTRRGHILRDHEDNNHLEPSEWNRIVHDDPEAVLIDTRNWYEYEMGTFRGALNPQTDKFSDFFDQVDKLDLPKDKKILIFCTGGIRCHKGIHELQSRGYSQVYQLKGGILKYLEEYPHQEFQGECFVFDHRVSVDQNLQPSVRYGLCAHCGNPGVLKHTCLRCGEEGFLCQVCETIPDRKATCSKNCAYHYRLHPDRKVRHGRVLRPVKAKEVIKG